MHDLTAGPIRGHIIRLAIPMAIGMLFQTLYVLVDLFFVARLGDAAIAGVSAAGNLQFIIMAATQVLAIGTMVLIAHAAGRKDRAEAALVFNQSLVLSAIAGVAVLVLGLPLSGPYLRTLAADQATIDAGAAYLRWFLPALALQFALVAMGSALRGTGIARPTMVVQVSTVVLNAILTPVLIAGWGTGRPMGVAGAGLASSISVAVGVLLLAWYFHRLEEFVRVERALWRPAFGIWRRLFRIGVPAGGEFALMFASMAVIYVLTRQFGAAAQAGFGVGSRVMQAIFLPAMAVAFAAAPVAAQNVGGGQPLRARETFLEAVRIGTLVMATMTFVAHWRPEWMVGPFSSDPVVIGVAAGFLRTISWNFVASGVIFTCSGMFQALGNTVPAVVSSGIRFAIFVAGAIWISRLAGFQIHWIWRVSVVATTLHAMIALALLRVEVRRRLPALLD